jgi:DNA-binding transcriptional regulator YiaG
MFEDIETEVRTRRRLPPPSLRRSIREAAGVSQARLGQELGVGQACVSSWESGRREPRGDLAAQYALLLAKLQDAAAEQAS